MNKRYQVFVSSTYADLQDERAKVIQTLMEMDCIPAGMELFPAMDEEQFEFIKKIIDDCDYYLLILGARYGSISVDDGLSYTEKEYHYAKEKGMKIIALVHGEPDQLPVSKTDRNPELYEKLVNFRNEVCTNRLVKFWTSAIELPSLVALNLPKTIKAYPAVGWVRGNTTTSSEVLEELRSVKNENDELNKKIQELSHQLESYSSVNIPNLAGLDHNFTFTGHYKLIGEYHERTWTFEKTIGELFNLIAPSIQNTPNDTNARSLIKDCILEELNVRHVSSSTINDQQFQTFKIQLEALGLIHVKQSRTTNGGIALFWYVTEKGKKLMVELRVIRET
ncbi:DUF4062 domain-containing protein [Aeromonas veronii]|uniref:DUF4062 domain-containing protein n=2 Tax=Aeromonas veronii TaxID=654 RepID=UPI000206A9A5|nr:DUF4062 domain-containing protein [Aeromonas veronii]AEB50491.1 hypothetical protein B565_2456 [Aeromonas veronii B565]MBS4690966.1 DUF4062 domain-containing protein [Aeromonas veronii bv. veronii]